MCEAALEALVLHLKTFTLLQGTCHAPFDARLQTKPSEGREKPVLRRRKEEKGQISFSYMVRSTFPSESH